MSREEHGPAPVEFDEAALHEVRESRLLIDRYDRWLLNEVEPYLGQRVLEVGCGLGNLLRQLSDRELVVGIEPSAQSVAEVRSRLSHHSNVLVHDLSITDPAVQELATHDFDTAISLNVFEHIDDDELAMASTFALLRPGGSFVLIVPAHHWLYGPMDASIGHYRRYTKASVRTRLERAGFAVVHQKYVNMLGALGWLVNGRILRQRVPPSGQLRVLNAIVPLLETLEGWLSPPFGVSVLTVARKPALVPHDATPEREAPPQADDRVLVSL